MTRYPQLRFLRRRSRRVATASRSLAKCWTFIWPCARSGPTGVIVRPRRTGWALSLWHKRSHLSDGLTDFVDMVVSSILKRGLYRTYDEGATLRDHLGLAWPTRK